MFEGGASANTSISTSTGISAPASRLHSLQPTPDGTPHRSQLGGTRINLAEVFAAAQQVQPAEQDGNAGFAVQAERTAFARSDTTRALQQLYRANWQTWQVERRAGCRKYFWNAAAGLVNYLPFWAGSAAFAASGSAVASTTAVVVCWTLLPPLAERLRDTVWTNPDDELLRLARECDQMRLRERLRSLCAGNAARDVSAERLAGLTPRQNRVLEQIGLLYISKMCTDDLTCAPYGVMTTIRLLLLRHFPQQLVHPGTPGVLLDLAEKFVAGSISGALFMSFSQLARASMAKSCRAHGLDHLAGTETVNRSRALWQQKKQYLESLKQDIEQELVANRAALLNANRATRIVLRQRREGLKLERQRIEAKLQLATARASMFGFWAHDLRKLFSSAQLLTTVTAMLGKALCLMPQTLLTAYPLKSEDADAMFGAIVNDMLPGLFQVMPIGFFARNECIHLVGLLLAACLGVAEGVAERSRAARGEGVRDIELGTPVRLPAKVRFDDIEIEERHATPPSRIRGTVLNNSDGLSEQPAPDSELASTMTVAASDSTQSQSIQRSRRHGRLSNSRKQRNARSEPATPTGDSTRVTAESGPLRRRTPIKSAAPEPAASPAASPAKFPVGTARVTPQSAQRMAGIARRLSFGEKVDAHKTD